MAFVCVHVNNTIDCSDGDTCTMDDVCSDGTRAGVPLDGDDDGYTSDECGGSDCDDSDQNVNPGVYEAYAGDPACEDGIDNNCNGYTDDADAGCVPAPDWTAYAGADASTYESGTRAGSGTANPLVALMLPIGAVLVFRRIFRKR